MYGRNRHCMNRIVVFYFKEFVEIRPTCICAAYIIRIVFTVHKFAFLDCPVCKNVLKFATMFLRTLYCQRKKTSSNYTAAFYISTGVILSLTTLYIYHGQSHNYKVARFMRNHHVAYSK